MQANRKLDHKNLVALYFMFYLCSHDCPEHTNSTQKPLSQLVYLQKYLFKKDGWPSRRQHPKHKACFGSSSLGGKLAMVSPEFHSNDGFLPKCP